MHMLHYHVQQNAYGWSTPTPRPDFAILSRSRVVSLLYARHRDLGQNGLPREMLYQLAFYVSSQGRPGRATILYPTAAAAQETWLELSQPVSGEAIGRVILRPVDLIHLESLIRSGTSREQAAFARQLALGAIHSPLDPC